MKEENMLLLFSTFFFLMCAKSYQTGQGGSKRGKRRRDRITRGRNNQPTISQGPKNARDICQRTRRDLTFASARVATQHDRIRLILGV
jgi:hypothetical protein